MSEDGKNIVMLFQQMRRFCEEVAQLLTTADGIMLGNGWRNADSNVIAGLSYTLLRARGWIPQDVSRFYRSNKLQHIVAFISVIVDDWEKNSTLKEPLLTAGWFDYDSSNAVPTQGLYNYGRWHLTMPDRHDDGKLISTDSKNWPKESFVRVSTLGVPLVSIIDAQGLENRIIRRLIRGMKS